MSEAYYIEFNYRKAISQAETMEKLSERMTILSEEELSKCMKEIGNNWTGENADNYIAKGNKLVRNINVTAEKVLKTAAAIRTIAKNIYDAEMEALTLAEERSYNK